VDLPIRSVPVCIIGNLFPVITWPRIPGQNSRIIWNSPKPCCRKLWVKYKSRYFHDLGSRTIVARCWWHPLDSSCVPTHHPYVSWLLRILRLAIVIFWYSKAVPGAVSFGVYIISWLSNPPTLVLDLPLFPSPSIFRGGIFKHEKLKYVTTNS